MSAEVSARNFWHGPYETLDTGQPVSVYLLLDRSGSMSNRWDEAISSINTYVSDLANTKTPALITLALFDRYPAIRSADQFHFDVLRQRIPIGEWVSVSKYEAQPRGDTPLYDAVGKLVPLIEWDRPEKAVVVIMTDGRENASVKTSRDQARALLDRCRARNWQVVFLGADFDAFEQAGWLGASVGQTLNTTRGSYAQAMNASVGSTVSYAATGQAFNYTDADRARAAGKTS